MWFTRRVQAFELLDSPRCPPAVRDGATDYLQFIIRTGNAYGPIATVLASTLASRGQTRIVDLCSGGGGPWPELRSALIAAGAPSTVGVTLTDLFPNHDAFKTIAPRDPHVRFDSESLDIERGAVRVEGMRTMFSAFHHFPPALAERVLRNLTSKGDEIFIAEVTQRSVRALSFMLFAPLVVWLATPFIKPFRLSRMVFTYLVPIIPFVVCFDGIVSCLRTYTPNELRELFSKLDDLHYDWTIAEAAGRGQLPVTYAIGVPKARRP